ncbi:sodium-dependent dopamine transporter-like [Plectropomus leopardus]|uniref:sodium-dependent dopamine transporter-like n=1 Tax=Plectropomus leopardus TaxID=160734 RepID=UPI001C4B3A06|nr:sodium-dependent dopamine transporter-like [Plectropomus leopardus]
MAAMERQSNRPTWSRQIEFTLAGIGCAVGLGNVWRFPYLCYRSGGGAFLVPYLLMLVVLGIPLLYMELTVGQYTRRGPVHALANVCPLLKKYSGVGIASVAISFIMCTYYNIVITWALYYLFSSFQAPLPWQSCNNTWNTLNCTNHATNSSFSSTASQEFFNIARGSALGCDVFFMLLCLGLDSEFAMVEVMVTSLMDEFYQHLIQIFKRKELFVLAVCGAALLLGIPCVMQVGIYVFQLMDHYTAIVSIMFLAFFEVVAICWCYGGNRLSDNLEEMTGKRANIFFRLCWLVVAPGLITVILVFSVIQFKPARYENYVFPPWAQGVGWVIAMGSIIWIPLGAVHTLWVLPGSLVQKLKLSITRSP